MGEIPRVKALDFSVALFSTLATPLGALVNAAFNLFPPPKTKKVPR